MFIKQSKKTIISIIILVLFITLSFFIKKTTIQIDLIINSWTQWIITPFWIEFFNFIAWLGDTIWIVIIGLLVIVFFYKKKLYLKIWVLVWTMTLTVWSSTLVKFLVARERPENRVFEYHWHSFPSGHATMSILFYSLMLFLILEEIKSKTIKRLLIAFSITLSSLVIFSRIYLSVHWFSDIIWGILLWSFWLLIWILVYRKLNK